MAGDITGLGVYRGQGAAEVFSENFAFAGTITTASDYVVMEPEAGAKHTRLVTTGCRITSAASAGTVRVLTNYLRIEGLCILNTINSPAVSYNVGTFTAGANDNRVAGCILKAGATAASASVIRASRANLILTVENTVVYGPIRTIDTRGIASATINHVTSWCTTNQIGLLCDAGTTITNTYSGKASGSLQDFWLGFNTTPPPGGSNNVSSDTTATVDFTGSAVSKAGSAQFTNVTVGSEDFSLKAGAFLIDFGTGALATDIIGATRDGSPDVGAFEFVAEGGGTILLPASDLALSTAAPTVSVSDHKAVSLGTADLTLDATAPTVAVSDHHTIALGTADLTLDGAAPTVTVSDHKDIALGTADLVLDGAAPAITQSVARALGTADLTLDATAPTVTVSDHKNIALGTADLVLDGAAITVANSAIVVSLSTGDLTLTSEPITVVATSRLGPVARVATLPVTTRNYSYKNMVQRADPRRDTDPVVVYEFGRGRNFVE
jgi:hypothetical protein